MPSTAAPSKRAPRKRKPTVEEAQAGIEAQAEAESTEITVDPDFVPDLNARTLPVTAIVTGRNARAAIDPTLLAELALSIKAQGIINPINVRPRADGKYEVVAGHRRFAAAQVAGLTMVPVTVGVADDQAAFVKSLVENIQREDLAPIDEARAFQALLHEGGMTQTQLGKQIGRSQAYISNQVRLLKLPTKIQDQVQSGQMGVGQAKAILTLPPREQAAVANKAVKDSLTAQEVEAEVRKIKAKEESANRAAEEEKIVISTARNLILMAIDDPSSTASTDSTYVTWQAAIVLPLAKEGFKIRAEDHRTDTRSPQYECDCDAFLVSPGTFGSPDYIRRMCIVIAHKNADEADRNAKRDAEQKANIDLTRAAQQQVYTASFGDDALVSPLGIRLFLYSVMRGIGDQSYFHGVPKLAADFIDRHSITLDPRGGDSSLRDLTDQQLAVEMARWATVTCMPNVWGMSASYTIERDAEVREDLVKTIGLEPTAVWGGIEPPASWTQTIEEAQAADLEVIAETHDSFGNAFENAEIEPSQKHDPVLLTEEAIECDFCDELITAPIHSHDPLCPGQHLPNQNQCIPQVPLDSADDDAARPEELAAQDAAEEDEALLPA
jgi:ParB family chromosome partitioning protein